MSTSKIPLINSCVTKPTDERIGWFLDWIRSIMSGKLARNMEQVFVHNIDNTKKITVDQGAIIAPNHVSYWDSCLYFLLSHMLEAQSFVFVAKTTLLRLPFLRWCGSTPLDTRSKDLAIQQLIAAKTLNTKPTQFWIFPQGQHRPINEPLEFKKGVTVLAQNLELPIVPVAIQYLYEDGEQPIAYISFRCPIPYNATLKDIEQSVRKGLNEIQAFHMGTQEHDFTPLFKPPSKKQDDLATRVLAWFSGKILGGL